MTDSSEGSRKSEKRRARRRRSRVEIRFWNEEFEAVAFTSDISDGGLLVETTRRLEVGTRLHVEIRIGQRSYFTEATVARRRDYPPHAQSLFKPALGLRFVGLSEALAEEVPTRPENPTPSAGSPRDPGTPSAGSPRPGRETPRQGTAKLDAPTPSAGTPRSRLKAAAGEPSTPAPDPFDPPTTPTGTPTPTPTGTPTDTPPILVDLRDPARLRGAYARGLVKAGILVDTERPVRIGDVIRIALQLPPPHGQLPTRGKVVSKFGAGRLGLLLEEGKLVEARVREMLDTFE